MPDQVFGGKGETKALMGISETDTARADRLEDGGPRLEAEAESRDIRTG